ncbi:MAG: V-type ATP synthase subunit E [Treponema sp.]
MEVQLQELIEKIKTEGVGVAEEKATSIIKEAESKAEAIIKEAESKAEAIVRKAKEEEERFEKASTSSIRQAARNTIISFRESLVAQLDALIKIETLNRYDGEVLTTLIPEVVLALVKKEHSEGASVMLKEKDAKALEKSLIAAFKAKLMEGINILPDYNIKAGFKVSEKGASSYCDFTNESVAEAFSAYLSPRLRDILKEAAKEI